MKFKIFFLFLITFFYLKNNVLGQGYLKLSKTILFSGDNITLKYASPKGSRYTSMSAKIYFWINKYEAYDIELKKNKKNWIGNFQIPKNTKMFLISFNHKNDFYDNNLKKGYTFIVYKGKTPAVGAYGKMADLYINQSNPPLSIKIDTAHAISLYKKELSIHSKNNNETLYNYYCLLPLENLSYKYKISHKIDSLQNLVDENDLVYASKYLSLIGDKIKSDSLNNITRKLYPNGITEKKYLINKFFEEDGIAKKTEIYLRLRNHFSLAKEDNNYDELKLILALNNLRSGNKLSFYEYYNSIIDKYPTAISFKNVSAHWVNSKTTTNDALLIASLAVEIVEDVRVVKKSKPQNLTLKEWMENLETKRFEFIDNYAFVLYKNHKYDQALKVLQPVVDANKVILDKSVSEHYILLLSANKKYSTALQVAEATIKSGNGSEQILKTIDSNYLASKGDTIGMSFFRENLKRTFKYTATQNIISTKINEVAANFILRDLEGNLISLESLKGKVVVLDFWATWCEPCKISMPAMQQLSDKYNDNKVVFLFIDTWETNPNYKSAVAQFIKKNKYNLHIIFDEIGNDKKQSLTVSQYKVLAIPMKFIIDKSGNIRFTHIGYPGSNNALINEMSIMIDNALL